MFFAFTQTGNEVSMMVDEKGLEVLRKGLPFHERDHLGHIQDWSAISVYEGPEAISS